MLKSRHALALMSMVMFKTRHAVALMSMVMFKTRHTMALILCLWLCPRLKCLTLRSTGNCDAKNKAKNKNISSVTASYNGTLTHKRHIAITYYYVPHCAVC